MYVCTVQMTKKKNKRRYICKRKQVEIKYCKSSEKERRYAENSAGKMQKKKVSVARPFFHAKETKKNY